jgi:hypothetical protein
MSDDTQNPSGDQSAGTQNTGQPAPIPYDRFKEVNDEKKRLETRLQEFERKDAERLEKERIQRGEHEQVIAELKTKAGIADQLEARLSASNQARIARIPDTHKSLIPAGFNTAQLDEWLTTNETLLIARAAPGTDAGVTGDKTPPALKLTTEQEAMARALNIPLDKYAANLAALQKERGTRTDD